MKRFHAIDNNDLLIATFETRDAAAGACQDAARENGDDGQGYRVVECTKDGCPCGCWITEVS